MKDKTTTLQYYDDVSAPLNTTLSVRYEYKELEHFHRAFTESGWLYRYNAYTYIYNTCIHRAISRYIHFLLLLVTGHLLISSENIELFTLANVFLYELINQRFSQ